MSKLHPCPLCNFSGPSCLCTRPDPRLVIGDPDHWWSRLQLATAKSLEARRCAVRTGSSANWRQKQTVEHQSFRLADIAWVLHHGAWPAGYVEILEGTNLDASNLVLHPLPRHLPRNRAKLRGARQESPTRWTAIVSRGAFAPLGSFLTPEEAHLAYEVLSAKLAAADDPAQVWLG